MGEVVNVVTDGALQVEVVKRVAEADKVAANKAAQEAKAIKIC